MRRLLLILFILTLALPCQAKMNPYVAGCVTAAAGTTYPDIIFWLNFEANDTTGTYDLGSSECAATSGDTSGTYGSGGTISGSGCKVGTYCFSAPTNSDYISFTAANILSHTKGRIGIWWYSDSVDQFYPLLTYQVDADNYWAVDFAASEEIRVRWEVGNSLEVNATSTAADLPTTTWTFIELVYDSTLGATDYFDVYVNGTRVINSVQAMSTMAADGTLYIGDYGAGTGGGTLLDNLMISNDPSRDFYSDGATDLSVTASKPSGSCP